MQTVLYDVRPSDPATFIEVSLVLLGASSESFTWTLTVEDAGPSGNVQSKLPAPVEAVKSWFDFVPFPPQDASTSANESFTPASVVLNV